VCRGATGHSWPNDMDAQSPIVLGAALALLRGVVDTPLAVLPLLPDAVAAILTARPLSCENRGVSRKG